MTSSLVQLMFLLMIHSFCNSEIAVTSNVTDYEALLAIKSRITHDPFGVVTSWNDSVHFCSWQGITCGRRHVRVTIIDLRSKALSGSVSPYIGNLTFLQQIYLYNNSLHGQILSEIPRLPRLRVFSVGNNSFTGPMPSNLSGCTNLNVLSLSYNGFQGEIPPTIGDLVNLQVLAIHNNPFHGQIPDSIGNLSSLQALSARSTNLDGSIPDSLGQLKSLTHLGMGNNSLSGVVPPSIYNLSSLTTFSLGGNQIQGSLPPNLGFLLPKLQIFDVGDNQFVGEIPASLSNASELEIIRMYGNGFTGKVPATFGILQNVSQLLLFDNSIGTGGPNDMEFLASLANCTKLKRIQLSFNQFGGSLPTEIANLSTRMEMLNIAFNQVSGTITSGIGNLVNLVMLNLYSNHLTGSLPTSIGQLQKLQRLTLSYNKLTGELPSSLGNITWLSLLYLNDNLFQGTIPGSLENCKDLLEMDLSMNNLSGILPVEVFNMPFLSITMNLSNNYFTGSLPSSVENLKTLRALDVSWNKLSCQIPYNLGSCKNLEVLFMQHNSFGGSIPSTFSSLLGIQFLDLSQNSLNGSIPDSLEKLKLLYLNLSFNDFEGEVPTQGIFKNHSAVSIAGNARLCGGIPELLLPSCPVERTNNQKFSSLRLSAIVVGCCLFVGLTILLLWFRKKKNDHVSAVPLIEQYPQISYEQILRATNAFSLSNLIGVGSFGSVYKGSIHENGELVAIKVLNLQRHGASRSFTAECKALRNVRHRNLVRIITSCSSIDFQGNDFKALVYEYMPNGSLDRWLHQEEDETSWNLNLDSRLNIAIDVASALDYLHHSCSEPIIHCDLKPSNVLLDNEMTGHVGDFGLARVLVEDVKSPNESTSVGVKGTIGYAAPEYGLGGEVSREGDVYSFGILLLEMMTGKKPTDGMFENGLNLHKFAMKALTDRTVMEIVDLVIVKHEENEAITNRRRRSDFHRGRQEECVIGMVEIGVTCSMDSPTDRMDMRLVVQKLLHVRDAFQKSNTVRAGERN